MFNGIQWLASDVGGGGGLLERANRLPQDHLLGQVVYGQPGVSHVGKDSVTTHYNKSQHNTLQHNLVYHRVVPNTIQHNTTHPHHHHKTTLW